MSLRSWLNSLAPRCQRCNRKIHHAIKCKLCGVVTCSENCFERHFKANHSAEEAQASESERNPRRSVRIGGFIKFGMLLLGCLVVLVAILAWRQVETAKKELAEANRLWDGGQNTAAVTKYKSVLGMNLGSVPSNSEKPTVFQRVIDFEVEKGHIDEAKALIEKALNQNVDLSSTSNAAKPLIAQARADREKREAEERARHEAEARRKQEERERAENANRPVDWTGKLGTGKLGTGATAYDELPDPWRTQFLGEWKAEVAVLKNAIASAESSREQLMVVLRKAQEELVKYEMRNKVELLTKDAAFLSMHKDRKAAVAKAEAPVKDAESAVLAAKERLSAFEKNDPPYFKPPFDGCKTFRDIENRLANTPAQNRAQDESEQRPRLSVDLVNTRVEPFRTAQGLDTKMVYVDWKNTGNRPVRAVYANIKAFDRQGRELYSASDYTIYAVFDNKPGIAPTETYSEPNGEGHILPTRLPMPAIRVTVEITRAKEKGLE